MKARKQKHSRRGRPRKPRPVTLPKFNGDHGTGTCAALAGTQLVEVKNDLHKNPNNMARRERINVLAWLLKHERLTMRQWQAGNEIQIAYGVVQSLSSGGPIKERVQASPKPDAVVAMQVDAHSRLLRATKAIPSADRHIVEHVCFLNRPVSQLLHGGSATRGYTRLRHALNLVADRLGY